MQLAVISVSHPPKTCWRAPLSSNSDAFEALKSAATDSRSIPSLKEAAVEGLGFMGGPEARALLIKILQDSRTIPGLKQAAARALGQAARS
ncbi:HEAT repeat domain-containing protein [Cupriavidus alkaliphilus]|uniref:HEAT repeat domain-containing protein n=1 Tax=Cupriavidus alkaliphilus TaxID=942866 RepID=UPI000E3002BF